MKTVSKSTIAALLLSSTTVFMGGTAIAQQQPAGDDGSSQGGANVILPQDGASGQADTRTGATTQAEELKGGADAAAQGSSEVENGGKSAETAGSTDSSVEAGEAKSPKLDANGASTTTTTEKNAEADVPSSKSSNEASTSEPSNETTASIDITTEQRTEIRNVIVETKAEPVKLDIDVNVGVVVPRTVELRPLPPRIIEIVPAYRGYEYFVLVDGRIIIVEPGTLKVVYVISA